jgi:hypothetical protein
MAQQWCTWDRTAWGAVFVALAAAQAADLVPDLDKVEGIKHFNGPPAARELLKRNGFVVVPRFYHQIFSPYIHEGLPPFVTTDSLHRTFHVIFEEQIKKLETALAADVEAITKAMLEGVGAAPPGEARRLAHSYFLVGESLLAGGEAAADAPKEVAAELALIRAANAVAKSPIFGYAIDYTQFRPRGFYTETPLLQRYFRAMSWYGNAAFRLVSDRETRAAMLIAQRFAANEGARKSWAKVDRLYTHLIAPADDLTPEEYAGIIRSMQVRRIIGDPFEWFKKAAAQLRDPKINSMVLSPGEMPRWGELSKGMRLFGKRYVPDSEVFTNLTYPAVEGRGFPSGLDVMAVLGSARARELQDKAGETKLPGYGEGFSKSRKTLDDLLAAKERSHYVESLKLAKTLLAPPGPEALPFMRTPAYTDKNLMTALAMWTSLRHTWQLQAKQSVTYLGLSDPPPPGYVEPNITFLQRLEELVAQTIEILREIPGTDLGRLQEFRRLVSDLHTVAEKQLAGKPLTISETVLLQQYAPRIAGLSYFTGHSWHVDGNLPWMSLIADVHTEHASGKCLEEGIGGAMPIFVAVPHGGKLYLMVGGVYSYYEFLQPISQRLTDEGWKQRWEQGNLPPMPAWTGSFMPGRDVEALLEKLRGGEVADDLRYVHDPRIPEILKRELSPGGRLVKEKARRWAIGLYGRKAGRDGMPLLLSLLDSGSDDDRWASRRALAAMLEPQDIPTLKRFALESNEDKAWFYLSLLAQLSAWTEVLDVLHSARLPGTRLWAVRVLGAWRVRDATPALLAAYPNGDTELRQTILQNLDRIWARPPYGDDPGDHPRSTLSPQQEARLRKEVCALVLDALREPERRLRDEAIHLVPTLQLEEAIPILETLARARRMWGVVLALEYLESDKAGAALLRMLKEELRNPPFAPDHCGRLVEALQERRVREAVPALATLLDDRRDRNSDNLRVCDTALGALGRLDPDGPGCWLRGENTVRASDELLEVWKLYLKIKEEGGLQKAHTGTVTALAEKLLALAETPKGSVCEQDPVLRLRFVRWTRNAIPFAARARRDALTQKADLLVLQLTRKEVREIVQDVGGVPQHLGDSLADRLAWLNELYVSTDRSRLDKDGRICDPWGQPYRFLEPARYGQALFDLYSFGPNGKDEDGGGDDIASWKQD